MNSQGGYRLNYWLRLLPVWTKLTLINVFWPRGYQACVCAAFLFQPLFVVVVLKSLLVCPQGPAIELGYGILGIGYFLEVLVTIYRSHYYLETKPAIKIAQTIVMLVGWLFWNALWFALFIGMSS